MLLKPFLVFGPRIEEGRTNQSSCLQSRRPRQGARTFPSKRSDTEEIIHPELYPMSVLLHRVRGVQHEL
jgi:hypothetical protein